MIIYLDGSYRTSQCFNNSKLIYFTSSFLIEELKIIEIQNKVIKRVFGINHYGNLAELTSAKLALEYLRKIKYNGRASFLTDSKVLESWLNSALKNEKKVFSTKEHLRIYEFIKGKNYEIKWIPREQNKAGIILEQAGYQ